MTLGLSTAARNAMLDAIETAIGTSAIMKIYGGAAMPANCATARAGTVLATLNLPSDYMSAASGGQKALLGSWADASADATGLARYFTIFASDGTTVHMQGLCSMAWAASTAVQLNQHVHNGGNVYVCTTAGTTASSGGPTGTGSGITDGTAVWAYVGGQDMSVDNVSLAITQAFSVTGFTLTGPNP